MSLWNSTDANTGAPKFAIFAGLGVAANGNVLFGNVQAGAFHANVGLGVDGLTPAEKANTPGPAHAGWVSKKIGTGRIASIEIAAGGKGYVNGFINIANGGVGNTAANASFAVRANGSLDVINTANAGSGYANGFLTVTGGGTGNSAANVSYTVNGGGSIVSTTIVNGGSNYNANPTVQALGANTGAATITGTINNGSIIAVTLVSGGDNYVSTPNVTVGNANSQATFTTTMNGRANRIQYETLVAGGNIA